VVALHGHLHLHTTMAKSLGLIVTILQRHIT
jgi:hypothetical protein